MHEQLPRVGLPTQEPEADLIRAAHVKNVTSLAEIFIKVQSM